MGLALGFGPPVSGARAQGRATSAPALPCAPDDGGLTLPPGFCATVFADGVGHARHLVVSPQGVVYVNTWSGRYYGNDKPPSGGFLVALRDTNGDGIADQIVRFGDSVMPPKGGAQLTDDQVRVLAAYVYALRRTGVKP